MGAKVQQSHTRDNQQETLAYIAGLMDSDGHISIGRLKQASDDYRYRYQIYFSNTDAGLINAYTGFLKTNGLTFYIRRRPKNNQNYMTQYEVSINNMGGAKKFLEMVSPYLRGIKKEYSKIVLDFLNKRINRKRRFRRKRNDKGQFTVGYSPPYLKDELALYKRYRELRAPQRLHAMPPPRGLHERVKI